MKNILCVLLTFPIALLCVAQVDTKASDSCLSLSDAEKILGQKSALTENSSEVKDNMLKFRCTYTADKTDTKTNKLGHLTTNQNMPNLQRINDLGDEAFRHTDFENFDMIIIRKGNKLFRLKINRITSMTDTNELQIIAKKLTVFGTLYHEN
jgi:hypothetical protein